MAEEFLASNEFPGNGVTTLFNVSFKGNRPDAGSGAVPYLNPADVKGQIITPATATSPEVVVDIPVTYVGPNQFSVTPAVPVGKILRLYRATQDEYALVDYQSLQTVSESDLDLSNRQLVFIVQESRDLAVRADIDAGEAVNLAYEAINTANDAADVAAEALGTANSAAGAAAAAVSTANSAVTTANNAAVAAAQASADAADAQAAAESVVDTAAGAVAAAGAATNSANTAINTANNALAVASGISSTADAALAAASAATSTANNALSVANGIDAKAQSALDSAAAANTTANSANSTANTALSTANGIASTADTALTNANAAVATANAAQPGDDTLTTIAALNPTADQMVYFTGLNVAAVSALTAFARTLLDDANAATARATLGALAPNPAHIQGLGLEWVSGTSLRIHPGAAYIPSTGDVIYNAAAITLTGLSLPASGFAHVYLYGTGSAATVEVSTTAPVAYAGTCFQKTGDASRRYLGSVLCASGAMVKFRHLPETGEIIYLAGAPATSPYLLLSGHTASAATAIATAPVAPAATTTRVSAVASSSGVVVFGTAEQATTFGTSQWLTSCGGGIIPVELPVSRAAATLGQFLVSVVSGAVDVYATGYTFNR